MLMLVLMVQVQHERFLGMIGFFIAGGNCTNCFVEDAATAEAMSLRDRLMMVEAMGCSNLVINSDCVEVIDMMMNGGHTQRDLLLLSMNEDCLILCK
jgi:hypothetical protein